MMAKNKLLIAGLLMFGTYVSAQDYAQPTLNDEVIVESNQEITATYRERRSALGAIFSINYEPYSPDDYKSLILNKYFDEISDSSSVPLFGAEIGVKYNFALGSIAAIVGYSQGSFSNKDQNLNQIDMSVMKVDLNYTMDNLTSEPWVAPYIQGGIHQTTWSEESKSGTEVLSESFVTEPNFHLKEGVLFQLNWIENWIDSTTTEEGLRTSGLQNTFVDIFYSYYMQPTEVAEVTGAKGEADISSSSIGAGLKLEF